MTAIATSAPVPRDRAPGEARPPGREVRLLRCPECDLLLEMRAIPEGTRARCGRCGAALFARTRHALDGALALYASALILWVVANAFNFVALDIEGRRQSTLLITGALDLYRDGLWELALLVSLFVVAFPLLKILANLTVLVPLVRGRRPRRFASWLRLLDRLHPWAMTEVFLLGLLVAYAKMVEIATIEIGASLFAFVALIVAMIAGDRALDPVALWELVRPSPLVATPTIAERRRLVGCPACRLVSAVPPGAPSAGARCVRCRARLRARRPDALQRCFALLVAAAILYVPANVFPVMTVFLAGRGVPSTIVSGVRDLIRIGMWPLALLVFVASLVIPLMKMAGIVFLMVSVRLRVRSRLRERAGIYRLVEAIGRWSMVDIFVVSVLVALVRMGSLASVRPGVGAISFAAVVILTMLAAMSFDPRLMWDAAGANRER